MAYRKQLQKFADGASIGVSPPIAFHQTPSDQTYSSMQESLILSVLNYIARCECVSDNPSNAMTLGTASMTAAY